MDCVDAPSGHTAAGAATAESEGVALRRPPPPSTPVTMMCAEDAEEERVVLEPPKLEPPPPPPPLPGSGRTFAGPCPPPHP